MHKKTISSLSRTIIVVPIIKNLKSLFYFYHYVIVCAFDFEASAVHKDYKTIYISMDNQHLCYSSPLVDRYIWRLSSGARVEVYPDVDGGCVYQPTALRAGSRKAS